MWARIVTGLLVVQLLGIALTLWIISGLIERIDSMEARRFADRVNADKLPSEEPSSSRVIRVSGLSAPQVRRIVSEEIDRAAARLNLRDPHAPSATAYEAGDSEPRDDAREVDPEQALALTQEIERHISVGAISPKDMYRLQAKIGRLDPKTRRKVLRKLVKAMNEGALKGRL